MGGGRGEGPGGGEPRKFEPRGEDRPYHPRQRPVYGPPMRGPRHDDPDAGPKAAHPLAQQFRREREEKFRRDRGSRPYKKTHY